ncbi:esterase/lipase family protein [Oligoflexus tunisiensis]|uniref:esterase/lipase family protein n=1 Tax=Oligoflexus tunisiensis TaxID=708132 RepID=UPI000AE17CFF|nr:alpha/beta hydrolase [Oligoflexus tunisiensis]
MTNRWKLVDQLKGATRLAVEATHSITSLVETMHHTIGGGPALVGQPLGAVTKLLTAPTYGAIRGVTGMVGCGLERVASECEPFLSTPGAERGVFLAALNGVLGDYLVETNNPLAIEMRLCHNGRPLRLEREALEASFPQGGRPLILLHGSSLDEGSWLRKNHDHGVALAAELGLIPIYLRYNSGLHISQNGLAFAILLERLHEAWPGPMEDILFVGHSMGGLIARSACLAAEAKGIPWRQKLRALVTLGTPHHGAPMERLGNWVDTLLGISRYSAPLAQLGKIRSAGVTDLRYGNVLDSHWQDRDRFARGGDPRTAVRLPAGVACFAVAASRSLDTSRPLAGDGIVPVASALGQHGNPEFDLAFAADQQWVAMGTSHLGLLSSRAVHEQIHAWLKPILRLSESR